MAKGDSMVLPKVCYTSTKNKTCPSCTKDLVKLSGACVEDRVLGRHWRDQQHSRRHRDLQPEPPQPSLCHSENATFFIAEVQMNAEEFRHGVAMHTVCTESLANMSPKLLLDEALQSLQKMLPVV